MWLLSLQLKHAFPTTHSFWWVVLPQLKQRLGGRLGQLCSSFTTCSLHQRHSIQVCQMCHTLTFTLFLPMWSLRVGGSSYFRWDMSTWRVPFHHGTLLPPTLRYSLRMSSTFPNSHRASFIIPCSVAHYQLQPWLCSVQFHRFWYLDFVSCPFLRRMSLVASLAQRISTWCGHCFGRRCTPIISVSFTVCVISLKMSLIKADLSCRSRPSVANFNIKVGSMLLWQMKFLSRVQRVLLQNSCNASFWSVGHCCH